MNHLRKVEVGEAVAIVGEKHVVAIEVWFDQAQSIGNGCTQASVDKCDVPIVDIALHKFELAAALRKDEVVGYRFLVLQEIVLDDIGLIAQAENKILVAEVGI